VRRSLGVILALFAPLAIAQTQRNFDAQILAAHPSLRLDFNDTTTSFRDQVSGLTFVPSATGTILARQPGFDATAPDNTSASFTFDSYTTAPNGSIGSFEWNQAFSIHYTVDGLTAAPAALLSKGDYSSPYSGIGYGLDWGSPVWWAGVGSLCFRISTQGASGNTAFADCIPSGEIPYGYNLDIWATYAGTGDPSDLHLYINGAEPYQQNWNIDYQSPPPGSTSTMVTPLPLHIPGDAGWGAGGAPLRVDEVDLVPGVVSQETIQGTFVHTKFYQAILTAPPTVPPKLILSDDGCGDMDNIYAIELAIAGHRLGYLRLAPLTSSVDDGGFYRALLDNAGLNSVPLVKPNPAVGGDGNVCNAATTIPAYNASIDMNYGDLPDAATTYRRIVAGLADGEKVVMAYGGPYTDLAQFMQSPADSISPLSGMQMFERSVQMVNFQGGAPPAGTISAPIQIFDNGEEDSDTAEYVVTHNGAVPLNWYMGTPQGPSGSLFTRTHNDPLWLTESINGTDTRSCWDCLPVTGIFTNAFRGVPMEGQMVYGDPVVGAGEYSSSTSNQWFYPPTPSAMPGSLVYTWFLNSLINPVTQGQPRAGN